MTDQTHTNTLALTHLRFLVARVIACKLRLIAPQRVEVGAETVDLRRVLAAEAVVHVGHLDAEGRWVVG